MPGSAGQILTRILQTYAGVPAKEALDLENAFNELQVFDTEVGLLASTLQDGCLGYASDTNEYFFRKGAAWSASPNTVIAVDLQGAYDQGRTIVVAGGQPIELSGSGVLLDVGGVALFSDGSTTVPSIAFANSTGTGFSRPGANQLSTSTAGVERVRVTSAGETQWGSSGAGFGIRARVTANGRFSNDLGFGGGEAFGAGATVAGTNQTAIGAGATTTGGGSAGNTAIGQGAIAGDNSLAVGSGASAFGFGGTAVGKSALAGQNSATAIGRAANANTSGSHGSVAIGNASVVNGQSVGGAIAIGSGATALANQLVIGSVLSVVTLPQFISDVYIGNGVTAAAPQSVTYHATGGSGTDIAAAALNLAGGRGTGTGLGGSVVIQTAPAGGSGTTQNALVDHMFIDSVGNVIMGTGEGGITAATGTTVRAPDVATGGAGNVAGADATVAGGLGTGTGTPGVVKVDVPVQATAGDNAQSRSTIAEFGSVGTALALGLFGAAAVTQRSNIGTLIDSSGGAAPNGTVQALTDPADTPATADALRDDLVANLIPELRNNLRELLTKVNSLEQLVEDYGLTA